MKISAIVMASGLSKRMGENKLFLDLKGKKLYEYTLDLLDNANLDEVIVVSSYEEILDNAMKRGFITVFNDDNEIGKSSSIKLGINKSKNDNALMFFVADQPLLKKETVDELIDAFNINELITYPVVNERRGAPVIFPNKFRDDLLTLEGDQGGMIFAYGNDLNLVEIEDEAELLDIDTIEAYEKLKGNDGR